MAPKDRILNPELGKSASLGVDSFLRLKTDGTREWVDENTIAGGTGVGDVVGPASAVDGHLAVFDGTSGKLIKDGGAATGSLVLLEQHAASSSASLDFTAWYSSTYDEYEVHFINVIPGTGSVRLWMRMSTNGGSSYDSGANYSSSQFAWNESATGVGGDASAGTEIKLLFALLRTTAADGGLKGKITLFNPASTTAWKAVQGQFTYITDVPKKDGQMLSAMYESTTAVNAFQFLMSSGNIASGTIRVYGVAK